MNGEIYNRKVLCDIAHCAFEVINRLLSRDQLLARETRSATTHSRQIYREECITVEMAATLRERFPGQVEITLFTPPEETRTGADWYWRFESGKRAIHARVQAKRVQRTEFSQDDSHGHVDIDLPQLTQLLQATSAATDQLSGLQAWLATYARFHATPPCGYNNLTQCIQHQHQEACENHEPSLWIAKAQEIEQIARPQMPVRNVIQNSVRLDCMLPCITGLDAAPGPATKGFTLQTGLQTYQECIEIIERDVLLRSEFEGALRIAV
ncbi:MAG: hypothetical protein H6633_07765 [Anaerolineales bacterium]|nr:hypothetical protein [Anaerolineales bacterium]